MSTQALYLKYRPLTFEEVVGQEHVTRTLRNALRQGTFRHAYLFTGPRGTGKTTMARILAKAVNCLAPEPERPCNACDICAAINDGRLLDLIEVDAASNRGIDEIRDIREKVRFRPNQARYKVYVLDEAHMLTGEAFNALLKTLEEPPPHVLFVLVTTEPHKIPATIGSRCQRFDFRRVPLQAIMERLATIAGQEGFRVEPEALEMIARYGTGAVRDAVSLLDQLSSYGDEISLAQVQTVLGSVPSEAAGRLVACVAGSEVARGLELLNRLIDDGADPRQVGREVVEYLRGVLLVQQGAGARLLNTTAEQAAEMEALASLIPPRRLVRAIHLFNDAVAGPKRGLETIPQLALELALVESIFEGTGAGSGDSAVDVRGQEIRDKRQEAGSKGQEAREGETGTGERDTGFGARESVTGQRAAMHESRAPAPESQAATVEPRMPTAALSLAQVLDAWERVLEGVAQRNRTTAAALRSGCRPVEVNGNELVIAFPFPLLRSKLEDPGRKSEVEQVLDEILHVRCWLKLVLASEYEPTRPVAPASGAIREPPAGQSSADAGIPEQISQWAKERGGTARIVSP